MNMTMLRPVKDQSCNGQQIGFLLHIGTHKTRTSSLQTFLQLNTSSLLKKGIFYAAPEGHRNANFLLKDLSRAEGRKAQTFFRESTTKARRNGADLVLLSAEAFYAMTAFRQLFDGVIAEDYRAAEVRSIGHVRAAIPQAAHVTIICYFRRQDRFLESIYNQIVKVDAYSGTISEFQSLIEPALDYAGHLELWRSIFPNARFIVRNQEELADRIVDDFLDSFLDREDRSALTWRDVHVNKRLGRDVLEYKRLLNRIPCGRAEQHMNAQAVMEISEQLGDNRLYQQYLDAAARANVLARAAIGNEALVQNHGMQPFSALGAAPASASYPGLSTEKAIEIYVRHRKVKSSFSYRRRWLGVAMADALKRRGGVATWLLGVLRKTGVHRLFA